MDYTLDTKELTKLIDDIGLLVEQERLIKELREERKAKLISILNRLNMKKANGATFNVTLANSSKTTVDEAGLADWLRINGHVNLIEMKLKPNMALVQCASEEVIPNSVKSMFIKETKYDKLNITKIK